MTVTAPEPTKADEALARIDQFIKGCSGRSLIDSDEVVDTLLDIRQLIKEEPCSPPASSP